MGGGREVGEGRPPIREVLLLLPSFTLDSAAPTLNDELDDVPVFFLALPITLGKFQIVRGG